MTPTEFQGFWLDTGNLNADSRRNLRGRAPAVITGQAVDLVFASIIFATEPGSVRPSLADDGLFDGFGTRLFGVADGVNGQMVGFVVGF
jgi:hypothetical protein